MVDKSLVRFFKVGLDGRQEPCTVLSSWTIFMHGLENAALNGLVSCRLYWSHLVLDFGIKHYLTCLSVLFCIRELAKATLRMVPGVLRKPCTALAGSRFVLLFRSSTSVSHFSGQVEWFGKLQIVWVAFGYGFWNKALPDLFVCLVLYPEAS